MGWHINYICVGQDLKSLRNANTNMMADLSFTPSIGEADLLSRLPFRTLVRGYDCDLCFTPMIVANPFVRSIKARDSEFTTNSGDRPLVVQFAASNGKDLADAAEIVIPFADGIDLNCGCPQRWAMSEGYGASLLQKPELVKDMIQQVRSRIADPHFSISIKIRVHEDLERTVDLCRQAEAAGISWITVHGRTPTERKQPARPHATALLRSALSVPVVINGDLCNLQQAQKLQQFTGAHGVMVARSLLANPALFAGFKTTPAHCISDWLAVSTRLGVPFATFHHHLCLMLEPITSRPERWHFQHLSSTAAVLDYLRLHYGI
uniref:Dihydrouridine synthase 4 like n=1 Tax=Eptatretus burgeri TaxID=7764 RepID=A0A8C4QE81_EPTBU